MSSTNNVPDSTDSKNSSSISSTSRFMLRPSSLSSYTNKISEKEPACESSTGEASTSNSNESSSVKVSDKSADTNEAVPGSSTNCSNSKSSNNPSQSSKSSTGSVSSSTDDCSFSSLAGKPNNNSSQLMFVFGQNIHERVTNVEEEASSSVSLNGTGELTFAQTASASNQEASNAESNSNNEASVEKLSESAKEYEARQLKRTYEEVAVVTGEEDESNILQITCKLFLFEKVSSNWLEKGRGLLRLNDKDFASSDGCKQSRIVMRTQGSLRVVLNTKVWHGMSVEKPSPKSVRISAIDEEGIKVYLIQANPKDANQLYQALDWRISTLKHSKAVSNNPNDTESDVDSTTESSSRKKLKESVEADTSSERSSKV